MADPIPVSSIDAIAETKASYRSEIDGLKALAVVAVIINHFNKEILPSGYLGVDIFFVISGFVITSSLANRPSQLGVEKQFYFLFPVLAWVTGFNRHAGRVFRHLWLTVALLSVASLITFFNFCQSHQPAAYFLMPARL